MDLLRNIFEATLYPGADVTKPLMIALLELLASRYLAGSHKAPDAQKAPTAPEAEDEILPDAADEIPPATVAGGLGGVLKHFQDAGLGDLVRSWIGTGPNESVTPRDIADALGPEVINALSQRTGIPRDQVTSILSQVLPQAVDKLTPHGRLPTNEELAQAG
jgi:uncharacterized protein YidB (DUF937 family)